MKPTLLILAAGMGSRYGGLKQIDKFGPSGESIIDYSIYDAIKVGFKKIVFIVRDSFLDDIKAIYEPRLKGKAELVFVTQDLMDIPEGNNVNAERTKPWGTAHAVLVANNVINDPFAVINGDDYYGQDAFKTLIEFFNRCVKNDVKNEYATIAYYLKNTLSEHGTVNRGICEKSGDYLKNIVERIKISKVTKAGKGSYIDNDQEYFLDPNTLVSMNMFGFFPDFFQIADDYFRDFLSNYGQELKSEFFIPLVLDNMIKSNTKKIRVLESDSEWFGVTYKEDKPNVMAKIDELIQSGQYPISLWT